MNNEPKPRVTLKDIAKKTGFSVNTVSRALREKDDISQATRELIKHTAEEMGHISNAIASSLRSGYTNTIAVILGDVSNLFFATMMKEIEETASHRGYSTILLNTNEDEDRERKAIQVALSKNVDGILICPTQKSAANIEYLKKSGKPFVLVGRRCMDPDVSYVVADDEQGGYQAAKHLLSQGHRRILMLHGPTYISSAAERLAGYMRAHEEFGLSVDPDLVRQVSVMAKGCYCTLDELRSRGVTFSAVFAFSDMLAWDVWSYLRKQGHQIPEHCSIVGFDNIQAALPLPFRMTSVSFRNEKISAASAQLLIDMIQNKVKEVSHIILPTMLVEGETVKPL